MYQPTTRLLTILELLQARPMLTGAELARRLEVDGRTVRRYVMMLQDMGIPVEAVHGRFGGYRLRPGYKLPPLMFTEEEALSVTLGLLAARQLGLAAAAPAVEGALAKLERVLPVAVREQVGAVQETARFTHFGGLPALADANILLVLSSAAQQEHRVWLRYRSWEGAETEREMDPYGLVFHRGRWYLAGLDHRSEEIRVFRVDRVMAAEPRDQTFRRPRDFDAVAHVLQALANVPWGFEIEVLLETTLAEARSRIPIDVANLEQTPEGVLLRTQGDNLESAARELARLGFPLVVIRPAELRDELRQLASKLNKMANRKRSRTGVSHATR